MSRKSGKNTPTVISNVLYTNDEASGIDLVKEYPVWSSWLEDSSAFYFQHQVGSFSARKQHHRRGYFWYAYKRINGKLHKKYLGLREAITAEHLLKIAESWPA
jgi:LuxR family maltose regulon positive regulatory protein